MCYNKNYTRSDTMNRIKILREEFGYTQQDLANKLSGAKSTIAMYENGTRKPSMDILIKLSEIFDCSIDYLLGKSDIKKNTIELDELDIAFASGIKGLNKKNQETLKNIMEGLLAKQSLEKKNDNTNKKD